MLDFSLGELAVIGAVALVVIGPEKLPKVARTAGMLFGRAQRMAAGFRADLERELRESEIAQLQKELSNEAAQFRDEMAESAAAVSNALHDDEPRILPETQQEAASPDLEALPASKPKRTRKKAAATSADLEVESATHPATPEAATSVEDDTAKPATVKKPRKRKPQEPQIDMFADPQPEPPSDMGDRR